MYQHKYYSNRATFLLGRALFMIYLFISVTFEIINETVTHSKKGVKHLGLNWSKINPKLFIYELKL